ncbi:tryptophan synthase subunit alpha [Paenactinomyces guangxiensis]|uniref:Tryptophan synthase alpha chain n=1 Tax=Paenactinomyces guangxiensis TaxID=1490290 RepID=A0A7W2AAA0_9BACL|nr:tryptophan synthase subunit alpha [Paenactinomyces guangxiensis]MBA4496052.1 tryptophan synthase subunit alpha [Paenactinomyces guangxiensis]MBH8593140.1 tryptophan synthase subunit alpha [Paenactinomyces guangxiensis]
MNQLQAAFRSQKEHLIPFIMSGDPSLEVTLKLIYLLAEEGAAAIELGVPFSDPMADGPVIQAASERALQQNVTLSDVLELGRMVRQQGCDVPLILFTYANPVFQYGLERLVKQAVSCGFNGVIVPDLPYEESAPLRKLGSEAGLAVIPLVAPTSRQRIGKIVSDAQGFVYCVSSLGTTGMRQQFAGHVDSFLQIVREMSPVPTAVGFGISKREHVVRFLEQADAVVVGSALVRKIEELSPKLSDPEQCDDALNEVRVFVRGLKSE